jgi:Ras family
MSISTPSPFPLVLIGNKCDLKDQREVTTALGLQLADEMHSPYFETSCTVNNKGVDEAFKEIVRCIDKQHRERSVSLSAGTGGSAGNRGGASSSSSERRSDRRRIFSSFPESDSEREIDDREEVANWRARSGGNSSPTPAQQQAGTRAATTTPRSTDSAEPIEG